MKNKKIKHYILIVTGILVLIIAIVIIVKVNSKEDTLELKIGPLRDDEAIVLLEKLEDTIRSGDSYPSYYGGAYLKNQNLVILITKDSREAEAEVREIVGQEEGVVIRYVKYPLNHLHEVQHAIREKYSELYEKDSEEARLLDLRSTSVVQESNKVIVRITDISNRKIRKFKKLIGNYDCVQYEEGGYVE